MDYYQSGGASMSAFTKKEFQLGNISKFSEGWDVPLLFFSILLVDVIALFGARYLGIGGKSLNKWYDAFGLSAVLADVLIILIGFFIARFIYSTWLESRFGWNPIYFVLLLVVVQLIHDIIFYFAVIKPIPKGHNEMMDVFKEYSQEVGATILSGDAALMIFSAIVAMIMKPQSVGVQSSVFGLTAYALPYILYTEPQWNKKLSATPEKKEAAKNEPATQDSRGVSYR
jgi:hypothetical protein